MAPHSDHESDVSTVETSHDVDIPVLIVGGGPTGLLLAHMLSQLGVKSLIIERYPTRLAAPKAHALSPRTLEICRQFDLDVNEIRRLGTNRDDAYWVNFVTSLTGKYVGSLPYERMDAEVLEQTPTMIHNIPQPAFEQFVAARLKRDGKVEVRKNHSFTSCTQIGDKVFTRVEDRSLNRTYEIRSRHVIACDGAKSKVREILGIECEGESSYETMMTIHFNANIRSVVGEQVGMLHWVMDPEVSGFIIGYDLDDNQVLICNFDSEKHPVGSWNEEHAHRVVTAAIGKSIPFDVLSWRPWILSRKVAEHYHQGNVFLAGDAAHAFPPTGGLGLNTGLADVHNLAYKLASLHQNNANPSLLSTYQTDRRQVAMISAQQSVKNGKKIFGLLKTLGTTDPDIEIAKKNLYQRITDPTTRLEVLKGIEGQREHFDNLGLHIGYVYGDTEIPASASLYVPSYRAGARLPHAWLSGAPKGLHLPEVPPIDNSYVSEFKADVLAQKQYSTLDLCAFDAFTIFYSSASEAHWEEVLAQLRLSFPKSLKINAAVLGKDFELVPGARKHEWVMGLQLNHGAGVLVRPDQHILNCYGKETSVEEVIKGLRSHLGL
ncbi:3-propionate hydroxylase [Mollisia scopiformis]|uniref:3-propionate hydroxylase n=1 Tax=Mollisia scopiformis TaxID=149040 RepID=A0A194X2T2_MOLSC|nr:3-propionate hydroxylase [Mollisia scopiformis]KUJ14152.1 3-propionate hydroxylase [Mollisia scopiformis]